MARHGKAWNEGSEPSCPGLQVSTSLSLSGHDSLNIVVEWQNGPYPFSSLKTFRVE